MIVYEDILLNIFLFTAYILLTLNKIKDFFINAFVILFSNNVTGSVNQSATELATADEYSQVSYNLYEFENAKP